MYFDSGSATKKDYGNIRSVLDDALTGYASKGGTFKGAGKLKQGNHVFNHVTEFPCVKQPTSSPREAFYALHHMRGFVRDQQQLTLPCHLQKWAQTLAKIEDSDLRQEFFRIQTQLAEIIYQDVCKKGRDLLRRRYTA
jgi:hypothetical protein